MVGFFPILDMVVAILSHPMMHLVLSEDREKSLTQSEHRYLAKLFRTLQCVSEALTARPLTCRRAGNTKTRQTGTAH